MYYYKSQKDDTEVIEVLQDLAFKHPTYGFRKLYAYIRRSGKQWNHKRIYRVYKLLKLNRKRKGKRRLPSRVKQPLVKQEQINQSWSMDFMSDSLMDGSKVRVLNVIDDYYRQCLGFDPGPFLPAPRVTRVLDDFIDFHGEA